MDPLTLLREFTKAKKPVVFENDQFHFDAIVFPRDTPTGFHSSKGEGPPYTLDSIWFMLKHQDLKYTDYLSECRKYTFPRVSLIDKRDLIAYLTGETNFCASIKAVALPTPSQIQKRPTEEVVEAERVSKKQKTEDDETIIEEKRKLAQKLNQPKVRTSSEVSANVDIPGGLDAEKLSQLRAKRLQHKRSQIKEDEENANQSKPKFIEADAVVTKDIMSRERLLRTRSSILQSSKKHFTSVIDTVTRSLRQDSIKGPDTKQPEQRGYDRYSDVQESSFWKAKFKGAESLDEFGIDTRGTFADMGRVDVNVASQKPGRAERLPPKAPEMKRKPDKDAIPIIIVPSALTSLLNMFNIKEFLVDGTYVSPMDKKNSGAKKESSMVIERKKGNQTLRYMIIDNTTKLTPRDWENVVAVFVLGAAWQFKGWVWENPTDLFSHVIGFYLYYEDEKIPPLIGTWNVKNLKISKLKAKAHLSQTSSLDCWNMIDAHVKVHKVDRFAPGY